MCRDSGHCPYIAFFSTKIRRMTICAPKKKKLVRNLQNFSRCVIMCRISWRCGLGGPCSVRCGAAPSGPDLRGVQGTALVGSDGKAEGRCKFKGKIKRGFMYGKS